jgi:hypothetical protein
MVFDNYQITAQASDVPSAQLTPLGYTSNGQFLLRVDGTPNSRFAIEATTNFLQWTALKTNVLTGGTSDFIDNISPAAAQRFYRARLVLILIPNNPVRQNSSRLAAVVRGWLILLLLPNEHGHECDAFTVSSLGSRSHGLAVF